MPRLCSAGCILLGASLLSGSVLAGSAGFSGITASANSAETASNNPAGMARLKAPSTTARLALANGFGTFNVDQAQSSPGGDPDNDFSPVLIPQGYHVRPLTEELTAGISLTVPSGFGSSYGSDWSGRYYTDSYSLVYVALTPAIAWRISPQWSVGMSLGINYTSSESEVSFRTLGPGPSLGPDGRLSAELDGVGTRFCFSTLWEMSAQTRFGLVYTTESETEIDGTLKFRNPGPVVGNLLARGLIPRHIEVEQVLPQRLTGGVYHELEGGAFITADLAWIDFSAFGTSAITLGDTRIEVDEGQFNDIWAGTLGYGFPVSHGRQYSIGAFFLQQPVDDDKRTLALPLDRIWGIGVGVNLQLPDQQSLDLNLNLADYGKSPVDTGSSPLRGRVVGETDNPYAVVITSAYHF